MQVPEEAVTELSGRSGEALAAFSLTAGGARGEKGVMTSLRALGVSAFVAAVASLGVACGDDGSAASGFSAGSLTSGGSGGGSEGSGGSTSAPTAGETTDSPTGGTGSVSGAESSGGAESSSSNATSTTNATTATTTTDGSTGGGEEGSTSTNSTTTNGAMCGNGAIDGTEQCDGANLNGFTCEALGNAGGTLQCDPVTCTFDTQLCEGGGGTSG